ncbi:MAG: TolB family protein [Acidimicrobiia bacterium]
MRILAATAICIVIVAATTAPGVASSLAGDVIESASGRVFINVFGTYGIPLAKTIPAVHEVEALDVVRLQLLKEGRIRDLPILVVDPPSTSYGGFRPPYPTGISHERECEASYGETSTPTKHIGECYRIEMLPTHSLEDLLAMMVALPDLSRGVGRIDVENAEAFRGARSAEIRRFRNLTLHFDPVWSPDGKRLLYTVWKYGKIRFDLLDPSSRTVTRLEPLDGYMIARPRWSDDSRFLAYAASRMVKLFDTQTRTTRTFRSKASSEGMQTLMQFEGAQLRFAFDVNWGGGYEVAIYDTTSRKLQHLPFNTGVPHEGGHNMWRHASIRPVRSPSGRHVAIFTFVNGQRRVKLKALQ